MTLVVIVLITIYMRAQYIPGADTGILGGGGGGGGAQLIKMGLGPTNGVGAGSRRGIWRGSF